MPLQLPLKRDGAWFQFGCELEGRSFGFTFRWNDRAEQWVMDVLDGDGVALVTGVKAVVNVPLLERFGPSPAMPQGALILVDTTDRDLDPGLEQLGESVQLFYVPTSELAEVA